MAVTTHPALHGDIHESGYDGRYRLYTVEHVPFDAFRSYSDGGPSKVAYDGWSVSSSSLDRWFSSASVVAEDDGRVTLNLSRYHGSNSGPFEYDKVEKHPLDGTKYPTHYDADRAAYEAGCTAFMVYEKNRARYGLPAIEEGK